jgi:hypothetical protein
MRKLIQAGPVEKCESGCGTDVRVSQYEGGKPRLNEVNPASGRDLPGGHTPAMCQDKRKS